jgi:hypothetical protein
VEATGQPASDLYCRLERSQKGSHEGKWWNIYLHFFAHHEEEEVARINRPLERNQSFWSQCYAQYKADHLNFMELLEIYCDLQMVDTEVTVGQCKQEVEKYEKKMHNMVSNSTISVQDFPKCLSYRQMKPIKCLMLTPGL